MSAPLHNPDQPLHTAGLSPRLNAILKSRVADYETITIKEFIRSFRWSEISAPPVGKNTAAELATLAQSLGLKWKREFKSRQQGGGRKPSFGESETEVLFMRVPGRWLAECKMAVKYLLTIKTGPESQRTPPGGSPPGRNIVQPLSKQTKIMVRNPNVGRPNETPGQTAVQTNPIFNRLIEIDTEDESINAHSRIYIIRQLTSDVRISLYILDDSIEEFYKQTANYTDEEFIEELREFWNNVARMVKAGIVPAQHDLIMSVDNGLYVKRRHIYSYSKDCTTLQFELTCNDDL